MMLFDRDLTQWHTLLNRLTIVGYLQFRVDVGVGHISGSYQLKVNIV